jgi:hypothetical protein
MLEITLHPVSKITEEIRSYALPIAGNPFASYLRPFGLKMWVKGGREPY